MFRQQKTAAARESPGEAPSLEHPLILSIQAYYALGLAGHFRPSSWNLMRPNLPAQGSSSDAIQQGQGTPSSAINSATTAASRRLRTAPKRRATAVAGDNSSQQTPPTPVAARNRTHTRGHPHPPPPGGQQDLMTDGLNTIDGLHQRHPAKHSSPPRHPSTRSIGTRNLIQAWQT